jgi:hypothetical protein
MNKMFDLKKLKKEQIKTALVFFIGFPIIFYLAIEYGGPILFKLADISENTFSKFPLVLIHGLIMFALGLACFLFLIIGFYLWTFSAVHIGYYLWTTYLRKNED